MRDGYRTEETRATTFPWFTWEEERYPCEPYSEKWIEMGHTWPDNNCTYDFRYGMHESHAYWTKCRRTSRNKGLFTAAVHMEGDGAMYTRQNGRGNRQGFECQEERDYYPYWGASQWRDIAILTDTPERCPAYKAESFNLKPRWECVMPEEYHRYMKEKRYWTTGYVPINKEQCENLHLRVPPENAITNDKGKTINVGVWTEVQPHGIPAPYCGPTPHTSNNIFSNLVNDDAGWPAMYNWTIPEIAYEDPVALDHCVIRVRYNVSAPDLPNYGWENNTSVGPSIDSNKNAATTTNNPPSEQATWVPIWEKYGFDQPPVTPFVAGTKALYNWENGYVFANQPIVNIFGSLAPKKIYLQLAIYTQSYGAVFEDRTHLFSFRQLPNELKNYTIHNLGVQGKRGNIVQAFPGTEYDFFPNYLHVNQGDLIHIQWNGANTNPRGNAGEGPAGFDRSNIVVMADPVYYEEGSEQQPLTFGQWSRSYPAVFTKTTGPRFLGLEYDDLYRLAIPPIYTGYFDLGLRQVGGTAAVYHYLSTRNNNFTNRSQKGKLVVHHKNATEITPADPRALASISARDNIGFAWIKYSYDVRRQGAVIHLSDAGSSGKASNWVRVEPRVLSVPDGGYLILNIEHPWVPFTYGRIFWTEDPRRKATEMFTMVETWSWSGTGVAEAKITMGGYYRVENVVNASAVGGVVFGFAGLAVLAYLVYRRFGCRVFNKTDPAAVAEQKMGLLPSSAASSDSARAPPASPAPAATS